jgi:3-carboxy-cis,cis-muconate cycloisomerase
VASPLFTTRALRAIFSDASRLARMLDFEAALAKAEARVGVIPLDAANAIVAQCDVSRFDVERIAEAAHDAGNLAIPLVATLTRNVAASNRVASGFVHYGATSQDAIDTGLVLQLRDALALIDDDLARLVAALTAKARQHAQTVMPGRTWLQQALPITLGMKLAGVVSALRRHRARLARARHDDLVLQFGGAAGTLASLGNQGLAVAEALADELALRLPDVPWHTHRDRLCDVAATLGMLAATLGKLGRDVALLAQTEVAEAFEPAAAGRGGSSTMPQKRNPVAASVAIAAAVRVPALVSTMLTAAVQEHERGLGNWPAEWETLPEIVMLTAGSLAAMAEVAEGLMVDADRMRSNLELTQGLVFAESVQMALAPAMGREAAHTLVADACGRAIAAHTHLRDILAADAGVVQVLGRERVDALFDAHGYLGESAAFIERALRDDGDDAAS